MKRSIGIQTLLAAALVTTLVCSGPVFALTASQELVGGMGCGEVTIITTIEYDETLSALGLRVEIPEGWVFESVGGSNVPAVAPAKGTGGEINFAWITAPTGPVVFSYTLSASEGAGSPVVDAVVLYRAGRGSEERVLVGGTTINPE